MNVILLSAMRFAAVRASLAGSAVQRFIVGMPSVIRMRRTSFSFLALMKSSASAIPAASGVRPAGWILFHSFFNCLLASGRRNVDLDITFLKCQHTDLHPTRHSQVAYQVLGSSNPSSLPYLRWRLSRGRLPAGVWDDVDKLVCPHVETRGEATLSI
jgi:hypothetical protein